MADPRPPYNPRADTVLLWAMAPPPRLNPVETDAYVPALCRHPRPDAHRWLPDLDDSLENR